MDKIKWR